MSKRRAASVLMFRRNHGFNARHTPPIVVALSGTGTIAAGGILTIVANSAGTFAGWNAYLTVSSGTNVGTLVGTFQANGFPI